MNRFLVLVIFVLCDTFALDAQYYFRSQQLRQGFETFYHGSEPLSDGSFAVAGIQENRTDNTSQMVLSRLSCTGEVIWAKEMGGAIKINNTNAGAAEADNGDIVFCYSFATGINAATMFVGRFTADGQLVWGKEIGFGGEHGRSIVATSDGGFVVAGSTTTLGVDRQRGDILLIKFDGDGNIVWNKTFGNNDAYDQAYEVQEDHDQNILVAGRYIVGGTFYAFLLKTDPDGTPIFFKGYGKPNHRTYGYAMNFGPSGEYLITGSTTIAKENFMSTGDPYLIKTDNDGNVQWSKIYVPTESDRSDIGLSVVNEADGGYGMALETSSFRAISGPQAPNKNAVFSIDPDGKLDRVVLFNPKGSQYTKLRETPDNGFFLSGFSTYYKDNLTFEPIAFKMDQNYSSGMCEEHDRTNRVVTIDSVWDVQDITYESRENMQVRDYNFSSDFTYDSINYICQNFPDLAINLTPITDSFCAGEIINFEFFAIGTDVTYFWEFGDGNTSMDSAGVHAYANEGTYKVKVTIDDGCLTVSDSLEIVIRGLTVTEDIEICRGEEYRGVVISDTTTSFKVIKTGPSGCDTVINVNVKLKSEEECCSAMPLDINVFSPNGDGKNDLVHIFEDGCIPPDISNYQMAIYDRWGEKVFETNDPTEGWDGKKDGEDCAQDVYLVTFIYETQNNPPKPMSFDVTLVR